MSKDNLTTKDFRGYKQASPANIDENLSRVGPETSCGEYLRRYWHPVALTSEVSEVPKEIRILGEDLVIFKTAENKIGLVHKNCPHRRASLVYGKVEKNGIRCCYHGWLFSLDGEILETPAEDTDSKSAVKLRKTLKLGAYPVKEFNGLVFSYMGPMKKVPEFPHYDSFDVPGITRRPYRINYKCNWIQVLDAIMDPVHTSFLHGQSSGIQFSKGFAEVGELEFFERGVQYLGCNTRRVDDHNSVALAWGNFGERGDPLKYNSKEGCERIEGGEIMDRTFEEKQKRPGDAEAVEGMGTISAHKGEHLMPTDQGIMIYRRRIRKLVKSLHEGKEPPQPQQKKGKIIKTNGQDTVLRVPKRNIDDRKFIKSIGSAVMKMQFDLENMSLKDRDDQIINKLSQMEKSGKF